MKLKVLGSGSSGNCYILENDEEALIIEAGVSIKDVKIALDFNIKKIAGVIITHSHKDHCGYERHFKGICPLYKPYEEENQSVKFGNFFVKSFSLVHDVPCFGFFIHHPDMGRMVYASDTEYVKYRFKDINHMLIEANYNDDLIDVEHSVREHILRGHMSLETALKFISTNDNPNLLTVCLIHLSASNSDAEYFLQKTEETIKYGSQCFIAKRGLEIDVSIVPFI